VSAEPSASPVRRNAAASRCTGQGFRFDVLSVATSEVDVARHISAAMRLVPTFGGLPRLPRLRPGVLRLSLVAATCTAGLPGLPFRGRGNRGSRAYRNAGYDLFDVRSRHSLANRRAPFVLSPRQNHQSKKRERRRMPYLLKFAARQQGAPPRSRDNIPIPYSGERNHAKIEQIYRV